MGMKFSMQGTALSDHVKKTDAASSDLGAMVLNFVSAAEPVAKSMNGPVKAAFNSFKQNVNEVADALDSSLAGILNSTSEQNQAFVAHTEQASQAIQTSQAGANFSAAMARNV